MTNHDDMAANPMMAFCLSVNLADQRAGRVNIKEISAYDLAIALTAWCGRAEEWPNRTLTHSFLDGYESARSIKASERRALPILVRGACLRFALTRLHDWIGTPKNAMVEKKNPMEYMLKLEAAKKLNGPLQ